MINRVLHRWRTRRVRQRVHAEILERSRGQNHQSARIKVRKNKISKNNNLSALLYCYIDWARYKTLVISCHCAKFATLKMGSFHCEIFIFLRFWFNDFTRVWSSRKQWDSVAQWISDESHDNDSLGSLTVQRELPAYWPTNTDDSRFSPPRESFRIFHRM